MTKVPFLKSCLQVVSFVSGRDLCERDVFSFDDEESPGAAEEEELTKVNHSVTKYDLNASSGTDTSSQAWNYSSVE